MLVLLDGELALTERFCCTGFWPFGDGRIQYQSSIGRKSRPGPKP